MCRGGLVCWAETASRPTGSDGSRPTRTHSTSHPVARQPASDGEAGTDCGLPALTDMPSGLLAWETGDHFPAPFGQPVRVIAGPGGSVSDAYHNHCVNYPGWGHFSCPGVTVGHGAGNGAAGSRYGRKGPVHTECTGGGSGPGPVGSCRTVYRSSVIGSAGSRIRSGRPELSVNCREVSMPRCRYTVSRKLAGVSGRSSGCSASESVEPIT